MGRKPKEKEKRISGTGYDPDTMSGKAAIQHLKYKTIDKATKLYEIDTEQIRAICVNYVDEATRTKNRTIKYKDGHTETEEYLSPISRQGLRRALDISRQAYGYWLEGYVSATDKDDDSVICNHNLMAALRAGDDAIMQYLAEDMTRDDQQRKIRMLESYGELLPQKQVREINANISLGKWAAFGK